MECLYCCFRSDRDPPKDHAEESASSLMAHQDQKHPRPVTAPPPPTAAALPVPNELPPTPPPAVQTFAELIRATHRDKVKGYDQLLDHYRVVRKLSTGTCAVVLLGLDSATGRRVAIKRQEKKGRSIAQIAREADLHFAVGGPLNIAELFAVSEGPSEVILVQVIKIEYYVVTIIRNPNTGF